MKQKLTAARVRDAKAPEPIEGTGRKTEITISDTDTPGLCLRVYSTGAKAYMVRYRVGSGRGAASRRHTIGATDRVSLGDARRTALRILSEVAQGHDPGADGRREAQRKTLAQALDLYGVDLERRGVVRRKD